MIWSLVLGVLVSLLVVEFTDWCPSMAAGIVRLVAHLLPPDERDRYREEWLAEVELVPGRLTRMVKAVALLRAVPDLRTVLSDRSASDAKPRVDEGPDVETFLLQAPADGGTETVLIQEGDRTLVLYKKHGKVFRRTEIVGAFLGRLDDA